MLCVNTRPPYFVYIKGLDSWVLLSFTLTNKNTADGFDGIFGADKSPAESNTPDEKGKKKKVLYKLPSVALMIHLGFVFRHMSGKWVIATR